MNRDEISRLELLQAAHPDGLVFPHLADAYRRAGRYAQAETVLNAGLRRHSDYSSAHVVLGRLRLDQGKHLEAKQAFRRVLELDPQNHIAMEYLGRVALEQGHVQEALDQFRKLVRLNPSEEIRGRLRELAQRVAELRQEKSSAADAGAGAEALAATAAQSDGAATSARSGRADPAPGNGSGTQRARPEEEENAEDPTLPPLPEPGEVVTETMAELYTRQGLYERAAAVYRRLLDRSPEDRRLRDKLEAVEAEVAEARPDRPGSGGGPAPEARPTPEARRDPEQPVEAAPATIRDELSALLAWQPGRPTGTPVEPAPASAPGGALEPRVEPEPRVEAEPTSGSGPEPESSSEPGEPEPEPRAEPAWPTGGDGAQASGESPAVAESWLDSPPAEKVPAPGGDALAAGDLGPDGAAARSLVAIVDMLVGLLEYRDPFFRGSSSLTRLVAEKVAQEMGLTPSQQVNLAMAAVLRDLGRLAMGGRLVSQPGQQTPESRRKIERHVDLALHLLEGIELPRPVRLAVRHHHERWDGAGYPDRLAGEAIPLLARVLAVVDSFAAMVSPRSYRLPLKLPDAARELQEAAGTQYDPDVVDALMRVLERQDQPHLGFAQRPHLLLVNPDQPGAVVTAAKLCSAGFLAEVSADPAAARERLRRVPVAAIVVSAEAGEEAAAEFVRDLRVDPLFSALPVVVIDADNVALRVRLLESGADVCFPPGTSYAELQGTLSALVRRTLRAGRGEARDGEEAAATQEAPWLALQGDIQDFPLTWLLQVMKYDSRTAAIGIRAATADGAIYLQSGDAIHAQIRGGAKGEAALRRMLQWQKGRFTVQPDAQPRERTIETSIMHLLLKQAVDEDHAAAGIFGAVSDEG